MQLQERSSLALMQVKSQKLQAIILQGIENRRQSRAAFLSWICQMSSAHLALVSVTPFQYF